MIYFDYVWNYIFWLCLIYFLLFEMFVFDQFETMLIFSTSTGTISERARHVRAVSRGGNRLPQNHGGERRDTPVPVSKKKYFPT